MAADGWPIACKFCLRDDPIGMTIDEFRRECKICTGPFTVFRWRNCRDARFKSTQICQTCSKLRILCQVCQLPFQAEVDDDDGDSLADYCRLYMRGECTRAAAECPYRHGEPSRGDIYYGMLGQSFPQPVIDYDDDEEEEDYCSLYECPYRHEMPVTGEPNFGDGINPVELKLLNKAGEMSLSGTSRG